MAKTTLRLGALLGLMLVASCGDDSGSEDVGMQTSRGTDSDATDDADSGVGDEVDSDGDADGEESDALDTDERDDGTETDDVAPETDPTSTDDERPPPDFEPPPPVLPDEDPQTPISELDEEQFEQVCGAYLDTASQLVASYQTFCAAQAVTTAQESGTTDTEAYRATCADALAACEDEAAAAEATVTVLECSQDDCSATLADFDGCRTQVAMIDSVIFAPIAQLDAPSCDEVTPTSGAAFSLRVAATVLVALATVSEEGGDPLAEESPCDAIDEQCPGLIVPVGAADAFGDGVSDAADAGVNR